MGANGGRRRHVGPQVPSRGIAARFRRPGLDPRRRRVGGVDLVRVSTAVVRITVASLALGAVAFGTWYALDGALGRTTGAQVVSLGVSLALGGVVYLGACRLLGVRELDALRQTVSRRSV